MAHDPKSGLCPECAELSCVGHCPKCNANKIGGGAANGMFCAACGHTWDGWDGPEIIDDLLDQLDAEDPGTL